MKFLKSQNGSALLMSVSFGAVLLVSSLITLGLTKSLQSQGAQAKYKESLTELRRTVMTEIDNDANWQYTVLLNSNGPGAGMDCLQTNGATCASGPQSFVLYKSPELITGTDDEIVTEMYRRYLNRAPDPSGRMTYLAWLTNERAAIVSGISSDVNSQAYKNANANMIQRLIRIFVNSAEANSSINDNVGYEIDGTQCFRYGSNSGKECPFKYDLTWECEPQPCAQTIFPANGVVALQPRIRVKGAFVFDPIDANLTGVVNTSNMAVDFIRGTDSKTLSRFCNTIKGQFDQTNRVCASYRPPSTDAVDCNVIMGSNYTRFVGFTNTNPPSPICELDQKLNGFCGDGTAVVRIRPNGTLECGAF